jgi:translation initiation factor IF-3
LRRRRNPGPPPKEQHRVNERIRIRSVFVIDDEGTQVGEMATPDALRMAQERGLDLVEVAPNQRPPVCRIMDYGKFKYQQKKKANDSKKRQHTATIKEVRVRPKIAQGDLEVKVKRALAGR